MFVCVCVCNIYISGIQDHRNLIARWFAVTCDLAAATPTAAAAADDDDDDDDDNGKDLLDGHGWEGGGFIGSDPPHPPPASARGSGAGNR